MALVHSKNLTVPLSFYLWVEGDAVHLHIYAGDGDQEGTATIISLKSLLEDLDFGSLVTVKEIVTAACVSAPEGQAKRHTRRASRRGATARQGK